MLAGEWMVLAVCVALLFALALRRYRAETRDRLRRRARQLVKGHPARILRATADARIRENVR